MEFDEYINQLVSRIPYQPIKRTSEGLNLDHRHLITKLIPYGPDHYFAHVQNQDVIVTSTFKKQYPQSPDWSNNIVIVLKSVAGLVYTSIV